MSEADVVDHLMEVLAGLTPDVLEPILDALGDLGSELSTLDQEDVVRLVGAAITGVAGAATQHYLQSRRAEVEAAVRRALTAT